MLEFLKLVDNEAEVKTNIYDNFQNYINDQKERGKYGMGIIHFNIRSLQKHYNELLVYVEMAKENLDIIVLSETGEIKNLQDFKIPNYNIYYNESKINKCDGVVVYTKTNIITKETITEVNEIKFSRLTFAYSYSSKNITVGITAIYRPPSTNVKQYIDNLKIYLENLRMQTIEIYLGDINIDLQKKESADTINYLNVLNSVGFISVINKPTRVTVNSESIIDHIFTRVQKNVIENIETIPIIFCTDMTDHYSPFLYVSFADSQSGRKQQQFEVTNINFKKIKSALSEEKWDDVLNSTCPQVANDFFMNKLNKYINDSTENKYILKSTKKLKPWISLGIITSIEKRDLMKKKLMKNYSLEKEIEYKQYRNRIQAIIRKVKDNYYQNKITEAGNNCKKTWDIIKDISGNKNNNNRSLENTNIIDTKGNPIENNNDKVNYFNNFFTNLGNEMAKKYLKQYYLKISLKMRA